jgi:vanillate O-demethylase ferredoxin subunit
MAETPGRYIDACILGRRDLTERIAEFLIGAADRSPLPPGEAGSHIELRFGGPSGRFLRHYSLVGPLDPQPSPEPFWRIAVQREDRHRGSAFLHATFREGTRLQVSRPIGTFRLSHEPGPVLLVAGGIGITPILPMLRSLHLRNRPFRMFYAGRSRSELAFVEEVEAMGGSSVTVHDAAVAGLPDLTGLLNAQPAGVIVYVCGPGPMIDALRSAAAGLGWDPARIRHEVFNAAHRPSDGPVTVRLRDGREVAVGPGTTILEALEAAGVDTLSDCRRGECGLCATPVRPGAAVIDHRDSYLGPAERAEGRHICVCCSRVAGGATLELDIA